MVLDDSYVGVYHFESLDVLAVTSINVDGYLVQMVFYQTPTRRRQVRHADYNVFAVYDSAPALERAFSVPYRVLHGDGKVTKMLSSNVLDSNHDVASRIWRQSIWLTGMITMTPDWDRAKRSPSEVELISAEANLFPSIPWIESSLKNDRVQSVLKSQWVCF